MLLRRTYGAKEQSYCGQCGVDRADRKFATKCRVRSTRYPNHIWSWGRRGDR